MTGAQIERVLNEQYDEEERYFLQISGLTYTFTETGDPNQPYAVKNMYKKDGTPLQAEQPYLVVINDFLFGGGDGFAGFTESRLINAIQPDTETFIGYIESKEAAGELIEATIEGRKKLADPEKQPDPDPADNDRLKKATIFDPLYEDDELLRGVTLPNATIVLFDGERPKTLAKTSDIPEGDLVGQADAQGIIKINVTSLKLQGKEKLTALVIDENQQRAEFTISILPKKETETSLVTNNTQKLAETSAKKELPKTGERSGTLILIIGGLSVSSSFIFLLKRVF
ncbi:5'-nucleotidase C-terminal domain-containing protein [Enterococcus termitis]